ncbi:MAG TPA: YdbL family protein [Pseudomonadales bacterium]|nr:YdbL family protein [Pseudomonadales bacterium]
MTIFSRATLLATGLAFSLSAFALTLDEAKQQGLVGEQPSGYLAVVGKSSPDVDALVNDINQKRRSAYEGIAKRNGTDVSAVEQLAGKKAIEQTPSGQFVKQASGAWVKVP